MSGNRKLPMSERLFNSPMNYGPSPRHLKRMIKELTDSRRIAIPMNVANAKDQPTLADFLKSNFSSYEIDWAHEQAVAFYKTLTKDNKTNFRSYSDGEKPFSRHEVDEALNAQAIDGNRKLPNIDNSAQNDTQNEKYVLRADYDKDLRFTAGMLDDLSNKVDDNNQRLAKIEQGYATKIDDIGDALRILSNNKPTVVEVKHAEKSDETAFVGTVHKQFPLLVKAAGARLSDNTRLNIWLYGPAGTGKTHAAKTLAQSFFGGTYRETNSETMEKFSKEFNREWNDYNYSPTLSTAFQVMGYMDANGKYVPTPFYLTWKYGGVFLLDEIDGSMQDALLGLNGALSSTYASFPCGMVPRHPDAIIMAGANTTGHGGDIEYLGTMKQNVAFLDRWTFIDWPHDDALENALVRNSHWVQRVRNVRANLNSKKIKGHVITMRASMQGAALLEAGIPFETVEQMVLRKGIPEGTWNLIK